VQRKRGRTKKSLVRRKCPSRLTLLPGCLGHSGRKTPCRRGRPPRLRAPRGRCLMTPTLAMRASCAWNVTASLTRSFDSPRTYPLGYGEWASDRASGGSAHSSGCPTQSAQMGSTGGTLDSSGLACARPASTPGDRAVSQPAPARGCGACRGRPTASQYWDSRHSRRGDGARFSWLCRRRRRSSPPEPGLAVLRTWPDLAST
jgi:hypothetical protein